MYIPSHFRQQYIHDKILLLLTLKICEVFECWRTTTVLSSLSGRPGYLSQDLILDKLCHDSHADVTYETNNGGRFGDV